MIEIIAECGVNHNGDLELAKKKWYTLLKRPVPTQ